MEKIIRSVCRFTDAPGPKDIGNVNTIVERLTSAGFIIQTKRICSPLPIVKLQHAIDDTSFLLSAGTLKYEEAIKQFPAFYATKNISFNVDLTSEQLELKHVDFLFDIIKNKPEKTFNMAYVFHNAASSPFFPSAQYAGNGFSVGLQATNLAENCTSLDQWLEHIRQTWDEISDICDTEADFLGIDSSIAPLFSGHGSFIHFIRHLGLSFSDSVTTDLYVTITKFLKEHNPRPIGLCGLMFPCLEDFELAEEYDRGEFSLERNIYLSLHSGLGIDTYPIAVDEKPSRALQILTLVQALSDKYGKPLSVRFVSDGKACIGDMAHYGSPYLKDVIVRAL